ncbi:MAG: glycosyl transferase [Vicinamibacterales bacterium]
MSDFYQVGVISTFHDLQREGPERLEEDLMKFSRTRPITLVIPALYSEFEGPALPLIIDRLRQVEYLNRIVLSLDRADQEQFKAARLALAGMRVPVTVVWNSGPRLRALYDELQNNALPVGEQGKGRSCWLSFGYVLAREDSEAIVLHDADVLTFDRSLLARLCYPVAHPNLGYEFCKGYYPRVSNRRMHGRVTRLLMTPLIRSLYKQVGYHPLLVYLDSFRYVLAGEMSMVTDLARVNRIPGDWGLEVGMLAEVYRNTSVQRVCQVGLGDSYEHKHHDLSTEDPAKGLFKMGIDICRSLFRTLAREGLLLSAASFQTLLATYIRTAEDTIKRFHDDAALNGLCFDRHAEETAVDTFARAIAIAGEQYLADPLGAPLIPNWNRVASAIPDFPTRLRDAVDADND